MGLELNAKDKLGGIVLRDKLMHCWFLVFSWDLLRKGNTEEQQPYPLSLDEWQNAGTA